MTIRHRLTLLYTGLLAAALTVFSVVLFATLRLSLIQQVDRELLAQEAEVRGTLQAQASVGGVQGAQLYDDESLFSSPGVFVLLTDLGGRVVGASPNINAQSLAGDTMRPQPKGATWQTLTIEGQRIRLLSTPLELRNRQVGTIRVGQSLAPVDRTLERLALLLALGTVLTTGLVGAGGLIMAGRALAPVAAMSARARTIVEHQDLDTRLPVVNPADELGGLARTFNEALDQIALLFQAQRRFVADAAHELRTPLTSIRGYTALLRRGAAADPEARDEALGVIDGEAARLTRLVNDLLLLAQSEAAPLEIMRAPVPLAAVVAEVLRQQRLLAPTHDWHLEQRASPIVQGDSDRLHQLCLNLLDNARRHTPPATRIATTLDSDGAQALLVVADNGPGIPAAALPHLFEPFFRSDPARGAGGAGLGLAIAARIAAAHGGTLHAANGPTGGATFTVRLPLATLDAEE